MADLKDNLTVEELTAKLANRQLMVMTPGLASR
jgi:hypothetical protein